MATCDTQTLMDEAGCFVCLEPKLLLAAQTSLLCQIAISLGAMATCDPATLVSDAACFACLPPNQLQALIIQLLCEIKDTVGGGGSGVVCGQHGNGSPEGVVTANIGCTYVQEDAPGVFWVKVANDGANTGWAVNT